ncbi:DNA helicase IV [Rathayibacter oskolensis]|uniref:DNA helicase IV n=1 Tax=Rathayibacter oskolensis TaxID=1891671 RepID=A0A1X7PIF6_9MICO|nr:RNA polymerase recycling motor ATPase HelR [Rathayibacter oskolensis]SMH51121.1 DNA helicase IV [Rathayibacter oskolensis]
MPDSRSFFALPARASDKRSDRLIARDDRQFAAVAAALDAETADLLSRLAAARRSAGGSGQHALDRDQEIRRLSARLRTVERFGVDLCLGRMVPADGSDPVYIGRLGLTDSHGERLLADWRSGLAAPFFGATDADPMGIASRRRYRWADRHVTDYWDEAFTDEGREGDVALDDRSAFVASLSGSRSPRMRDVLGTLQADQDAIVRAGASGALVVDGGPGTGKTVVALHRAAYLLFSDARVSRHRGGVLVLGPNAAYLDFVADVLPNLGEDGVRMATLRDLDPAGLDAEPERHDRVATLKGDGRLLRAVDRAVDLYEQPPQRELIVETDWADVVLTPQDWSDAFDAPEPGTPHDDARDAVWEEIVAILTQRAGARAERAEFRAQLEGDDALRAAVDRAWPLLDPEGVVADLWSSPEHLRSCAPWLDADEAALLARDDPRAWTLSDLPLLDAARSRVGDPGAGRRRRERELAEARERSRMDSVVDELVAGQEADELMLMTMLRGQDVRNALVDTTALPDEPEDPLQGPFAHVVVDEAQELTDAEWAMLLRRVPSRSVTVVGDRTQARHGFRESWIERLSRVGIRRVQVAPLRINYRTPAEIMAFAEPGIRAAVPDANVPTSIRSSGIPVEHRPAADLARLLEEWLASRADGTASVLSADPEAWAPLVPGDARLRSITPAAAKGLEFDLVVLVDPDALGDGIEGAVDRYVAMTRATQRLAIVV